MRILVTGGAGFIGSHVVEAYLEAGHQVCVVDNFINGSRDNLPAGVEVVGADLRDPKLEQDLISLDFDVICHHAAQISVPYSVNNPWADAETNVLGFINLMEIARKWRVQRIIYISSGGTVYGEPEQIPVAENAPTPPVAPYAASKLSGEIYLQYYRQMYGINYVVLRYGNVYGPRQIPQGEAGVIAIFMEHLRAGTSPTIYCPEGMPGGAKRDYIYVKDCARANVLALTKGDNQIFNIGSGLATSTLEIWDTLVSVSGQYAPQALKEGHRPGDIRQIALDCSKAESMLGWKTQHSLQQGLKETWQWFVNK